MVFPMFNYHKLLHEIAKFYFFILKIISFQVFVAFYLKHLIQENPCHTPLYFLELK
jgi:hypothetical protein